MSDTLRVREIFYSIQGEGPFSGRPAVFIRFAGCNLSCPFCDTDHESVVKEYTVEDLIQKIYHLTPHTRLVVLTGGEPFLHDIGTLVAVLSGLTYTVQVETNGTIYQPGFPYHLAELVCSPKPGGYIHGQVRPLVAAWKYLVDKDSPDMFGPAGQTYLQPLDEQDPEKNKANIDRAVELCLRYGYRLSLQLHKIIGVQ